MGTLKDFLASLAVDPLKLGNFIHDPEKSMRDAGLSAEDQVALRSGFAMVIHARLSGLSTKDAFELAISEYKGPQDFQSISIRPIRPAILPLVFYRSQLFPEQRTQAPDPWSSFYQWFQPMPPYYLMPPPYWWGHAPEQFTKKSTRRRTKKSSKRQRRR